MFYNALVKFRDEQLENYQGQPLEYSASDYHHISRSGGKVRRNRSSSKRRSHISVVKDLHRRMSSNQEPKSCASVESYDPYRSPKTRGAASEAKYAQITVHRASPEIPEKGEISPVVKPPPSIAEEEELEEEDGVTSSPFTVLQKRKHKPSSLKSFQSSKLPHSSSRCPGMSTRSTSYRRNVSFPHARNRSHGSTKPKRRKTATNQQSDLKRSPSAASLQMIADGIDAPEMPSSPPLPAQPTVVRPSGMKVRSLCQEKKIRDSGIIWKEDARKVSHELSQICEEAFNGSSVTTIRTASSATGYETPATPVSIASQDQYSNIPVKPSTETSKGTPRDPGRSYSIQELTETRRKLVEHSKGRSDNIPAYLSGVIGHLDRLIEENQEQRRSQRDMGDSTSTLVDPFVAGTNEPALPVINEEFASPVRGASVFSPKPKPKPRASAAANRVSDAKATIRMVPHSSLRSLEEVKPLMIRKKNQVRGSDAIGSDAVDSTRAFSASSRQSRHPCGLDPIEEIPASPKRGTDSKKWSWFKHRSQASDPPPALPPKDNKPIIPSNGTVVIHPPTQEPVSPIRPVEEKVPTRKTSMERFGGGLLKKLMPKKTNKNTPQPETGRSHIHALFDKALRPREDKEKAKPKDHRNSALLCKGLPDPESSFEADDPQSPLRSKRLSLANQNWFARVFQIKPASRVIALNTSKVKGRKEIYKLLREWKDYGMENVYMDKSNSIVHGQVSEVNCE